MRNLIEASGFPSEIVEDLLNNNIVYVDDPANTLPGYGALAWAGFTFSEVPLDITKTPVDVRRSDWRWGHSTIFVVTPNFSDIIQVMGADEDSMNI